MLLFLILSTEYYIFQMMAQLAILSQGSFPSWACFLKLALGPLRSSVK